MKSVGPYRVPGRREEDEEQKARLDRIAASGDVRSLVELLPLLPPEAHRLGPDAAKAATSVLERASPSRLAWFDQWYRGGWLPKGPDAPAWRDVRLGRGPWARRFKGVVALASFHANGFVRETAVRLLSELDDGFELPYLLIRTNDWVPKVRIAAATAAAQRTTASYVEHWVRCLGLVDRLRNTQRGERDAPYVRRVEELLLREDARPLLESALSRGELTVRRAVLRRVALLPDGERRRLLTIASRDVDPVIAIDGAKRLLPDAAAELLRHPISRVRHLALEAAVARDVSSARDGLEQALFDDARSVRETARHHLSKLDGGRDFAAAYRKRVSESRGREKIVALEALAEVGTADDLDRFVPLLHDPKARVRAAAIVAIGRWAGEAHLDDLEAALRDRSSVVRRAASPFAKRYLGRGIVHRARRELR